MSIRVKRGLEANRIGVTPDAGEPLFTTDTKKLYVGDGMTPGGIEVDLNGGVPAPVQSVAGKTGAVTLAKSDVGLSSVDNTADANKPVSTATQTALNAKANSASVTVHTANVSNPHSVTKAQVGLSDVDNVSAASLRDRSTHTGTQATSTVAGLDAALAGKQATLTSGSSIKTVNGVSLLGAGDVPISGGASDHTALTNIGTNTHAQIDTALTRLAATSGTNTGDNLIIGTVTPTPSVGAQVLWLDTTGGNITLNLVTG